MLYFVRVKDGYISGRMSMPDGAPVPSDPQYVTVDRDNYVLAGQRPGPNYVGTMVDGFVVWTEVPPVLGVEKEKAANLLRVHMERYVERHYPQLIQTLLLATSIRKLMVIVDPNATNPEKVAARSDLVTIMRVFVWLRTVLVKYYQLSASINACTTVQELQAIQYDMAEFDATDPNVQLKDVI